MDHIKKKRYQNYAVGVLIALALYILNRNVGALFNVFVSYAAGYRHYQDFQSSDHFAAFLVIAIASVVIHAFTGWLTVQLMTKYGQKRACVTRWYFRNAAIAVVVLAVIVLPLLSRAPGWLTYSSHALAILIFGERKAQQYSQTWPGVVFSSEQADAAGAAGAAERSGPAYCHRCGAKLGAHARFCHKCGTQIE